eukprot:CAMPEP_0197829420 /NCGR_PEP_ID=MMETSP1437-20131217/5878_1 /TAXON_ID=49252 ORGANISM="Eucampia antarctica, Strain CCMP1452" /NCGR_SAMPLE_ID=MMETSP1437 /ASSEMBLY_ACC=CAM_ASM_001096 /LENGTH=57 /DNA_ID=CAMNT_0043431077 /DNA_START=21 /DNA_END=194 /DNA_ORIENTATION=-
MAKALKGNFDSSVVRDTRSGAITSKTLESDFGFTSADQQAFSRQQQRRGSCWNCDQK